MNSVGVAALLMITFSVLLYAAFFQKITILAIQDPTDKESVLRVDAPSCDILLTATHEQINLVENEATYSIRQVGEILTEQYDRSVLTKLILRLAAKRTIDQPGIFSVGDSMCRYRTSALFELVTGINEQLVKGKDTILSVADESMIFGHYTDVYLQREIKVGYCYLYPF